MNESTAQKKEKFRVAIIGTGFGSLVHLPSYQMHTSFEPVLLCGLDETKTKQLGEKLEIEVSTDWKEVVAREDIDVISIATPPYLHAEISIEAFKNGKHVLCEKPLSNNLDDALNMVSKADESGLIAMCNFEFRYIPVRAYFVELMKSGHIGEIYSLIININVPSRLNPRTQGYDWWSNQTEGGGVLSQLGIHYIDFILQIFGQIQGVYGTKYTHIPKRLNHKTGKMKKVTSDDSVTVIFKTHNSQTLLQINSVSSHGEGTSILASGSKGTLSIKNDQNLYCGLIGEGGALQQLSIPLKYRLIKEKESHVLVFPFMRILDEFSHGIIGGLSHSPNFHDALVVQKIINSIQTSYAKKKYVAIDN